jgi:hypothetical protein
MVQQITAAAMGGGTSPQDAVAGSKRYGNFLGMELGFAYHSTAVVPDATQPPEVEDEVIDYVPSGRPGHRAPHVWLEREGVQISTLDLFGRGFTLLARSPGRPWAESAVEAGRSFGIEIKTQTIGSNGDFIDEGGAWSQAYGVADSGAVLVRPDGHVAWRSAGAAVDGGKALCSAVGTVLGRNG